MRDFCAAFAFCFRLLRHGALHLRWQIDVLNLHSKHFNSPRFTVLFDDCLQVLIKFFAFREQVIELSASEHTTECRLRNLRDGEPEVLHLYHSLVRSDNSECQHGVDANGDVVFGNDILRCDIVDDDAEADALHPFNPKRNQEDEPGPSRACQPAEAEDDGAFVFFQDADAGSEHHDNGNCNRKINWRNLRHIVVFLLLSVGAGRNRVYRVTPVMSRTLLKKARLRGVLICHCTGTD